MFVKIFADMLFSSVWAEDSDTRIVWLTLLMLSDQDGLVRATLPGISGQARVSGEATAAALARFEAPDPHSRTPDHEGRRIERVAGGYLILNYPKYRDLRDAESRREYDRICRAQYRSLRQDKSRRFPGQPLVQVVVRWSSLVVHGHPKQKQKQS